MVEKSKRHLFGVTSWRRDGRRLMMKVIDQKQKTKRRKKMNGEFFNHSKFANYQLSDDDVVKLQEKFRGFGLQNERSEGLFGDLFSWFFDPENTTPKHQSGSFAHTFTSLIDAELNISGTAKNTKFDVTSTCSAIESCFPAIFGALNNLEKNLDPENFDVEEMISQLSDSGDMLQNAAMENAKDFLDDVSKDAEKRQKAIAVGRSMGLLGSMPTKRFVDKNLADLMKRDDVIDLLESLGSLVSDAGKAKGTSHQGNLDVVGVTTGNSFTRLLPSEIARFDGGVLEDDLLRRVTSSEALNWQMENEQESGDFVLLIDMSASMQGERERMAKAFALFAASRMLRQNRKLVCTLFGSYASDYPVVEVKNEKDLPALFDLLSNGACGGTYIDRAMKKAIDALRKNKAKDLVVISDGELEAAPETIDEVTKSVKDFTWFQIGRLSPMARSANKLIGLSKYFEVDDSTKGMKKGFSKLAKSSLQV